MPQLTKSMVINPSRGETQVKIILELNINLNSNGLPASITAKQVEQQQEDEMSWAIPDFESHQVEFGKKIDV